MERRRSGMATLERRCRRCSALGSLQWCSALLMALLCVLVAPVAVEALENEYVDMETWLAGVEMRSQQRRFTELDQANLGKDSFKLTLMAITENNTEPFDFRVAIRQHNMVTAVRYKLVATIDCLKDYAQQKEASPALPGDAKIRWYKDGQRIRRALLDTYRFSLSGFMRANLTLAEVQEDKKETEELNGVYECVAYSSIGYQLMRKRYNVKIFFPGFTEWDGTSLETIKRQNADVPKTATMTVVEWGRTWVQLNYTLGSRSYVFNNGTVENLSIHVTRLLEVLEEQVVRIENPQDEGTLRITNLTTKTNYRFRPRTSNKKNKKPMVGTDVSGYTNYKTEVLCDRDSVEGQLGSTQSVICQVHGQPLPGVSMDGSKVIFHVGSPKRGSRFRGLPHSEVKATWRKLDPALHRNGYCIEAENRYNVVKKCFDITVMCKDPEPVENGYVNVSHPFLPTAVARYSCSRYFYLSGPTERDCQEKTATWRGSEPHCLAYTKPTADLSAFENGVIVPTIPKELNCSAEGIPPPSVQWLLNRKPMQLAFVGQPGNDSNILRLFLAKHSARNMHTTQNVTCVVRNTMGNSSSSVHLLVKGPLIKVQTYENQAVPLECLGQSWLPDIDIHWSLNRSGVAGYGMLDHIGRKLTLKKTLLRKNETATVSCLTIDKTVLQVFEITVLPAVQFVNSTPAFNGDGVVELEFGQPASVRVVFRSDLPDLRVAWNMDNLTDVRGARQEKNGKWSSILRIAQFTPDHERMVSFYGMAGGVKLETVVSLVGVQRGTCEVMPAASSCSQFLGGQYVYVPVLDSRKQPVFKNETAQFRSKIYSYAEDVFSRPTENREQCFPLLQRMLCEYLYPPCDPSSVQYANVNKSWPRRICREDCQLVTEKNICPQAWNELRKNVTGENGERLLGSLDCADLPSMDGGSSVECVRSMRYAAATATAAATDIVSVRSDCVCGNGQGYNGNVAKTKEAKLCTAWEAPGTMHPNYSSAKNIWARPVHNHCRNPEGRSIQPWCYTKQGWGGCDVASRCPDDIEEQGCKRYTGGVCSSVDLVAKNMVKTHNLEVEKLQLDKLLANSDMNEVCQTHLRSILCLNAYRVCDRTSPGSCGQIHQVCPRYCNNFKDKCPVPEHIRKNISDVVGYDFLDCEPYNDRKDEHDGCTHQPIVLADADAQSRSCDSGGYNGDVAKTKSGLICQPWRFSLPHKPAPHIQSYELTGNACRNPGGLGTQPWCYTMNSTVRKEYCNVPPDTSVCDSQSSTSASSSTSSAVVFALVVIGIVVPLATFAITILIYRRRAKQQQIKKKLEAGDFPPNFTIDPESSGSSGQKLKRPIAMYKDNPEYWLTSPDLFGITKLRHDQLEFTAQIAEGHFGMVWRGQARDLVEGEDNTVVAIKTLKADCNGQTELGFIKEAQVISRFKHVNIIRLLGVCIPDGSSGQPLCLLFEYMEYGDLLHFLREAQRRRRPTVDLKGRNLSVESADSLLREQLRLASTSTETSLFDKPLTQLDLCSMASQVAHGMQYLSSRRYVHRDLAARNCLVGRNHVVKLADFGLSRDVHHRDYYRPQGNWAALPVRWMPPEVIMYGKHTTESDAWSFGVLLWEVFTYGAVPYYDLSNEEVAKRVCEQDRRLPQPHECPPIIYGLMMECWFEIAEERPTFRRLWKALHTWRPPLGIGTSDYASGGTDSDLENISQPSDDVFEEIQTMVISPHGTRVPKSDPGRGSLTSPLLSQGPSLDSSDLPTPVASGNSDSGRADTSPSPVQLTAKSDTAPQGRKRRESEA